MMPDFDYSNGSGNFHDRGVDRESQLDLNDDLVMEQIISNINNTPIGQLLKTIASLPEVRKEKVLDLRTKITKGDYELSDRLDAALDKVLENIIA